MRFIAGLVAALAVLEIPMFSLPLFMQLGVMGEFNEPGSYPFQPLTTLTFWLTALPLMAAVAVLVGTVSLVSQYPRSSREAVRRTSALLGFALIHLAYFLFAVIDGWLDQNPPMFAYSLIGLAGLVLASVLLRVRPRQPAVAN